MFYVHSVLDAQNLMFIWIVFANSSFVQIVQKEREEKLAEQLKDRLNQYVQGNKEEFERHAEAEVARLSNAGNSCHYSLGNLVIFSLLFVSYFCL